MYAGFKRVVVPVLCLLALAACTEDGELEFKDPIDRKLDLTREDFRNMANPGLLPHGDIEVTAKTLAPPVPEIAPILAAPKPPKIGHARLVTITVTDDVPLKDVLIELARLADIDIELDAGIKGGVAFRAKDRPFNEVIERLADLAGLRYTMRNGVLRVERDVPYIRNYSLDFINIVRSSESSVNVATDVLALANSAGGEGGSGLSTGSTSSITASAEDDFWDSLELGITQILTYRPPVRVSENEAQLLSSGPPVDPAEAAAQAFVINRQAGILSVSATQQQHEAIGAYIDKLQSNTSAQVLIEAKIVEVSLNDQFQSGINWTLFEGDGSVINTFTKTFDATDVTTFTFGRNNLDINAAVNLVEKFGTTRTLSSPRLHAINNQQAVLTFAQNKVFFEVDLEREDDQIIDGVLVPGSLSVESTRRSVPIGIILNILPSIDLGHNTVTLSVRPTLSRQVDTVVDPGSAIVNQQILSADPTAEGFVNEVPVVEVRELDTILKLQSGQIMVIGGLMEQSQANNDSGAPFVSDVPWLGNLFKSVEKTGSNRELIIFIRATIVGSNGNFHNSDQRIYDNFTEDPRPLRF